MTGASIIRSAELPLQNVKSISDTSLTAYFRLTRLADSESYCLNTSSSILGIGWALFDSAQDDTNQQLTMVKIKSDVRRDGLKEEDCIELGRNYLEQHAQSGLDIKLMASNRDIHFSIRPEDVQNFLKSVDNVATDNKSSSGE